MGSVMSMSSASMDPMGTGVTVIDNWVSSGATFGSGASGMGGVPSTHHPTAEKAGFACVLGVIHTVLAAVATTGVVAGEITMVSEAPVAVSTSGGAAST